MVEDLLSRGTDGIAISPIDPDNQQEMLTEAARRTHLITQDSDAPDCGRLCYVGVDNYEAGRMCGGLVKQVMPEGGTVVIFIGRIGQLNARLRRQGVIDELLDRDHDSARFDPPSKLLEGERYTILDTCTDDLDTGRALAEAEDAISRFPELDCMVGLFDYNPPQCLQAIKKAGKLGEIHVVAFDEADATLEGITQGEIYGTIVQDPYRYGYESVRILAGLARGDQSVLPEGGFLDIPARKITKENVEPFWNELKRILDGETAEKEPPAN
jgi:ribose transport system substrate-binding protein